MPFLMFAINLARRDRAFQAILLLIALAGATFAGIKIGSRQVSAAQAANSQPTTTTTSQPAAAPATGSQLPQEQQGGEEDVSAQREINDRQGRLEKARLAVRGFIGGMDSSSGACWKSLYWEKGEQYCTPGFYQGVKSTFPATFLWGRQRLDVGCSCATELQSATEREGSVYVPVRVFNPLAPNADYRRIWLIVNGEGLIAGLTDAL